MGSSWGGGKVYTGFGIWVYRAIRALGSTGTFHIEALKPPGSKGPNNQVLGFRIVGL